MTFEQIQMEGRARHSIAQKVRMLPFPEGVVEFPGSGHKFVVFAIAIHVFDIQQPYRTSSTAGRDGRDDCPPDDEPAPDECNPKSKRIRINIATEWWRNYSL